jgi:predicted transglutaminase-like cysteine proteinase
MNKNSPATSRSNGTSRRQEHGVLIRMGRPGAVPARSVSNSGSIACRWWHYLFVSLGLYLLCSAASLAGEYMLDTRAIETIHQQHGEFARRRVVFWQDLIKSAPGLEEMQKLHRVNAFFNELEFINDSEHWGKDDYWATPLQTLTSNGGDCEDFSIAKYFTLIEMGVPAERLRLTYVKALELDQAHMVLTYYETPEAEPVVLDNLVGEIQPSSQRTDLLPVYSFNGDGLWLAKTRTGNDKRVGHSTRLGPWRDVIARISDEYTR